MPTSRPPRVRGGGGRGVDHGQQQLPEAGVGGHGPQRGWSSPGPPACPGPGRRPAPGCGSRWRSPGREGRPPPPATTHPLCTHRQRLGHRLGRAGRQRPRGQLARLDLEQAGGRRAWTRPGRGGGGRRPAGPAGPRSRAGPGAPPAGRDGGRGRRSGRPRPQVGDVGRQRQLPEGLAGGQRLDQLPGVATGGLAGSTVPFTIRCRYRLGAPSWRRMRVPRAKYSISHRGRRLGQQRRAGRSWSKGAWRARNRAISSMVRYGAAPRGPGRTAGRRGR